MAQARDLTSSSLPADDSPESVFQLMLDQDWSDGLPVIPPTPDRVHSMVEGSRRDPSHLVGYINPEGGAATVEKIAVNAVMAGCLPEYMPVLIAAVQAITEPGFNIHGIQTTTNPVAPALIINGPIRNQLGVNSGRGCLGPGWRANATIGRALRFLLINVGNAKPLTTDMAIHGMPGKYTFCFGENEEESVWDPLQVERGLAPDQSAVTVVGSQGTSNCLTLYKEAESILTVIASAMADFSDNNYLLGGGNPMLVLSPGHSRVLTEQGFTKQAVKEWLFEHCKIPLDRIPQETSIVHYEKEFVRDGDFVCLCRSPEDIVVVVAGGPEPYHATYCASFGDTQAATKLVATD